MFLKDQDLVTKIFEEGKEKIINSLSATIVTHGDNSAKCPVCNKNVSINDTAWMLMASAKGIPTFKDRFDCEECAELAIQWLRRTFVEYGRYLKSEKNSKHAKDDLRDSLLSKDDESPRKFKPRCIERFQRLADPISKINSDAGRIKNNP